MNDLYLEFAQSKMGKNIFDTLNLPQPPQLLRDSESCLSAPTGRILLASMKNGAAMKQVISALNVDGISLCEPNFSESADLKLFSPIESDDLRLEKLNLRSNSNQKFKHLVLDLTSLKTTEDLKGLYLFFKFALKRLKANGRIVLIASRAQNESNPALKVIEGGIGGFVRSLAKELGRKGATCNAIYLDKGTESKIKAALFYFLSDKSAFVTGQGLKLGKSTGLARKIDWEKPLSGKTALVTGAAQGIGAETAQQLARDGAQVVCLDIPANLKKLEKLCQGINGHPLAIDLSEPDASSQVSSIIASQLGVIDIVVHNAGITRDKTLQNMPEHFWDQVLTINLERIMQINQVLLSRNLIADKGRIVCVSSISGIAGNFGQTNYACSKAGVAAYVEALASQLENGITINAVAPGFIETAMIKKMPAMTLYMARRSNTFSQGGFPTDVAEAICLFSHPASQAISGNVLRVCGQNIVGK